MRLDILAMMEQNYQYMLQFTKGKNIIKIKNN